MKVLVEVESETALKVLKSFDGIKVLENCNLFPQNLMDAIPTAFYVKDKNFKYIQFNSMFEELTGFKVQDFTNKSVFDIFPEEIAEVYHESDLQTIEEGKSTSEAEIRIANGVLKHVIFYKTATKDKEGNFNGLIGVIVDITEQKEMEDSLMFTHAQLEEKNKLLLKQSKLAAMGEMISMIAHQWRQPLNIISMTAENMRIKKEFGKLSDEDFDNNIDKIFSLINHMSKTIDDFKNFFKNEKKSVKTTTEMLFKEAFSLVETPLTKNNISLTIDNQVKEEFYSYKNEIIQVLLNLLSNGIDQLSQSSEKREITISASKVASSLTIKFHDNGGGIPEDIIEKVFEPYFSTKNKNGTGLGLYMSKIIIEDNMNGNIRVENKEGGALFTISVPIV